MLLLSILTFITVVLIMTGALVPVLMYCAGILAVLYILVLIKNLFVSLFSPGTEVADEVLPQEFRRRGEDPGADPGDDPGEEPEPSQDDESPPGLPDGDSDSSRPRD